jgi:hypothetical protein
MWPADGDKKRSAALMMPMMAVKHQRRRRLHAAWRFATSQHASAACVAALVLVVAAVQVFYVGHVGSFASSRTWANNDGKGAILDSYTALVSSDFRPAKLPWTSRDFYRGLPISDYRPTGQFYRNVASSDATRNPPVITIVTATRDPGDQFFDRTVRCVLEQSLQNFRWIIVNDHSTRRRAVQQLNALKEWAREHEPYRILMVDSPLSPYTHGNGPAAMNFGLRFVDKTTKFVAILDDDDLWELTSLEKAALLMSWVPQAHAVSFDVVNHGHKEFLWTRGFYNGDESFFTENNLMQGSPFRASVLQHCRFREQDMADGGADWDFWMCMASHGMWGMHLPETGNWYQWNPPDFRKLRWKAVTTHAGLTDLRQRLQQRYSSLLDEDAWPRMVLPPPVPTMAGNQADHGGITIDDGGGCGPTATRTSKARRHCPFDNVLGDWRAIGSEGAQTNTNNNNKRVVVVVDSIGSGRGSSSKSAKTLASSTSTYALKAVRALATAGWRVTVLIVRYSDEFRDARNPARMELLRYTHDVFVAPDVAPLQRMPDLLAYLLDSRRIGAALIISSHHPRHATVLRRLVADAADVAVAAARLRRAGEKVADAATPPLAVLDVGLMMKTMESRSKDWEEAGINDLNCPDAALWFLPKAKTTTRKETPPIVEGAAHQYHPRISWDPSARADDQGGIIVAAVTEALAVASASIANNNRAPAAAARVVVGGGRDHHQQRHHNHPCAKSRSMAWWQSSLEPATTIPHPDRSMDMSQIQVALQWRRKRRGFGRELQIACPERVYANTQWIDALEDPVPCPTLGPSLATNSGEFPTAAPPAELDLGALRRSALGQCGAWCIIAHQQYLADGAAASTAATPVAAGWEFAGSCFRPIYHLDDDDDDKNGDADVHGSSSACQDMLRRARLAARGANTTR